MNFLSTIRSLVARRWTRISRMSALCIGVMLLVSFCAPARLEALTRTGDVWWLPVNVSKSGAEIDALFYFIYYLTLAVFIGTQVTMLYFIIRYRRRKNVRAVYSHGNNMLELVWTAIPLCIFIALGFYSNDMWSRMTRQPIPDGPLLEIDVVAQQFDWQVRYPGLDGRFGRTDDKLMAADNVFAMVPSDPAGEDDIRVAGEMVVPVGVPVRLHLRSRDVIHSFYVPEFRLFQDVVPGKTISWVWFETLEKGNFQIACSQLCGVNHYRMFAKLRVVSREEFDAWMQEKAAAQKAERSSQASASQTSQAPQTMSNSHAIAASTSSSFVHP